MKTTVEIKRYNQNHSLVSQMVVEWNTSEVNALMKTIRYSASKSNHYIISRIVR